MSSYFSDAREHMRKEDFEDLVRFKNSGLVRGDFSAYGRRSPIDHYETYYPACIRKFLPKKRDGNIMILYESEGGFSLSIGPHWPGTIVVVAMLGGGTWLNLGRIKNSLALQSFVVLLFVLSLIFLFLTSLTDPGVVRSSIIVANEVEAEGLVYCDICAIHRAPTTVHCFDCNCCIEEMDHHCPWMSKCIGKKK